MKTLLTAITLTLTLATAASAEEPLDAAEFCKRVAGIAESFMENRQAGVPMSTTIEIAGPSEYFRAIAIDAYSTPRYMTKPAQVREQEKFRDKIYLQCFVALSE